MYYVVQATLAIAILIVSAVTYARAEPASFPCQPAAQGQPPTTSCKVITLSPLEEQALSGQNQILDTAQQGRPLDLTGPVTYFREKLRSAPSGTAVAGPVGPAGTAMPPIPPEAQMPAAGTPKEKKP